MMHMVQLPCKIIQKHLKMGNRVIISSSNSASGYKMKRTESKVLKKYLIPILIVPIFTKAKMWHQPKFMPTADE